jgi:branched-chain amino acid transport system ATP-binding protein
MLELEGVRVRRGRLEVVRGVSLAVAEGKCLGLLGLNGAGKTSLMAGVAGTLALAGGSVRLAGSDLSRLPSWVRSARGLVLVPAGRQLFPSLTVLDNLLVGAHSAPSRREREDRLAMVLEYFPVLRDKRRQLARELSGGQQQMVAIGRGLMAAPRVLLLDEPSEGLAPIAVDAMFEAIATLRGASPTTIVLAEQNAAAADVCDDVLVMKDGVIEDRPAGTGTVDVAESVFS